MFRSEPRHGIYEGVLGKIYITYVYFTSYILVRTLVCPKRKVGRSVVTLGEERVSDIH